MLEKCKLALRISTDAFDDELNLLIAAAELDLGIAGVQYVDDPLCNLAVMTYVKLHFGSPDEYDKLERSYNEQKAQLSISSNYADRGGIYG